MIEMDHNGNELSEGALDAVSVYGVRWVVLVSWQIYGLITENLLPWISKKRGRNQLPKLVKSN